MRATSSWHMYVGIVLHRKTVSILLCLCRIQLISENAAVAVLFGTECLVQLLQYLNFSSLETAKIAISCGVLIKLRSCAHSAHGSSSGWLLQKWEN